MLHAVFDAWAADTDAGLASAMIAADAATVAELNALAQAHHRDTAPPAGDDTARSAADLALADGHTAGIGDRILTRRNDRRLPTGQHNQPTG